MKTLTQKKLLERKEFTIEEYGVFVSEKTYFSEKKYKVYFHSVEDSQMLIQEFPKKWFISTLLFGLCVLFQFYLSIAEINYEEHLYSALFLIIPFIFRLEGFYKNNQRYIQVDDDSLYGFRLN